MSQALNNIRLSPRQRMINLMYIVLTAMLALNVSSDVLDGFTQVEDGLANTNKNVANRNDVIFSAIKSANEGNPAKAGRAFGAAVALREATDSIYRLIDAIKLDIAIEADGDDADVENIKNRDHLWSASAVLLNPVSRRGADLRKSIDRYRTKVEALMSDSVKKAIINKTLSTEPFRTGGTGIKQLWEESKFENQPVVAAITLLTKMQNDILYAEGEALSSLYANIDAGDVRVNELNAFVIPQSRYVMSGTPYKANIVLAAVDTTARPLVYVNGDRLEQSDGKYEISTSRSGKFTYSGHLEVAHADGSVTKHPFSSEYEVMAPTATVSATMMNVLYAGIDNPISISVPGIPSDKISAKLTNGELRRVPSGEWVARPSKVGVEAEFTVFVNDSGNARPVNTVSFKVRRLPDPTPYISYAGKDGVSQRYKGGTPLAKSTLLSSNGLGAAIDDDLIDVAFKVVSFETLSFDSMGNAIPEVSNGSAFSPRQIDMIKRIKRGKRFYISRVKAIGPDGLERTLAPIEVMVN